MAFAILPCYRSVNRCVTAHRHWHKSNALHHTVLLQVCELLRDASLAQIECIAYTALNYRSANCCVTHHWHKSNALYHTVLLQVRESLRDATLDARLINHPMQVWPPGCIRCQVV